MAKDYKQSENLTNQLNLELFNLEKSLNEYSVI